MSVLRFLLLMSMACAQLSCSNKHEPISYASPNATPIDSAHFKRIDLNKALFDISSLDVHQESSSWRRSHFADDANIPLNRMNGRPVYHPSALASDILHELGLFQATADSSSLHKALHILEAVDRKSFDLKRAKFFPYAYGFDLHEWPEQRIQSPWISALSQGKMLSAYVRAFRATNDSNILVKADMVFRSYLENDTSGKGYWVSYIDEDSLLWLEEFPMHEPSNVLNGMITAIFGIYEYHTVRKDAISRSVLEGALFTVRDQITNFRQEGDRSWYCLKHKTQSKAYHSTHIHQLCMLYHLTGDEYFKEMAILFDQDYDVPSNHRTHDAALASISNN